MEKTAFTTCTWAQLGGYREVPYQAYLQSESFQAGIRGLETLAVEATTAFMCAEKLPWHCHRRFIARELVRRGWRVIHILDRDTVWDPEQPLLSPPSKH